MKVCYFDKIYLWTKPHLDGYDDFGFEFYFKGIILESYSAKVFIIFFSFLINNLETSC